MKQALIILTVLTVLLFGGLYLGWQAFKDFRWEALEQVHELQDQRDDAEARADSLEAQIDTTTAVIDSLEAVRLEEKRELEAQIRVLRRRADSITAFIGDLMPVNLVDIEIREAVMSAVADLNQTHEEEKQELRHQLVLSEEEIEQLQINALRHQQANESLRRSLNLANQQISVMENALDTGFFDFLWKQKGPLSAALGLGVLIGKAG
jgi:septal ring factor EnvC (AmiA/AmiB activator)